VGQGKAVGALARDFGRPDPSFTVAASTGAGGGLGRWLGVLHAEAMGGSAFIVDARAPS
jgi:hypothetical protein